MAARAAAAAAQREGEISDLIKAVRMTIGYFHSSSLIIIGQIPRWHFHCGSASNSMHINDPCCLPCVQVKEHRKFKQLACYSIQVRGKIAVSRP
jgi:hypothetical protein